MDPAYERPGGALEGYLIGRLVGILLIAAGAVLIGLAGAHDPLLGDPPAPWAALGAIGFLLVMFGFGVTIISGIGSNPVTVPGALRRFLVTGLAGIVLVSGGIGVLIVAFVQTCCDEAGWAWGTVAGLGLLSAIGGFAFVVICAIGSIAVAISHGRRRVGQRRRP